jgi:hypothetical protein
VNTYYATKPYSSVYINKKNSQDTLEWVNMSGGKKSKKKSKSKSKQKQRKTRIKKKKTRQNAKTKKKRSCKR